MLNWCRWKAPERPWHVLELLGGIRALFSYPALAIEPRASARRRLLRISAQRRVQEERLTELSLGVAILSPPALRIIGQVRPRLVARRWALVVRIGDRVHDDDEATPSTAAARSRAKLYYRRVRRAEQKKKSYGGGWSVVVEQPRLLTEEVAASRGGKKWRAEDGNAR